MKSQDILRLTELFKKANLNPNTIEDGVLASNLLCQICLVSKADKVVLQGIKRREGVLVEASIPDDGYIDEQAIRGLFTDFERALEETLKIALANEEREKHIQQILEDKPKKKKVRVKQEKVSLKKAKEPKVTDVAEHEGAIRYNEGKVRYDLIPPEFIREIAEVLTFGATKYSPDNWKGFNKQQQEEIKASLLRHIYTYLEGDEFDQESGLHHLAHAGCNLAFLAYFRNLKGV